MKNRYFKTKDLSISAALLLNGIELIKIDREEKVCWFTFRDTNKCESLSKEYLFGKLLVNARDYDEAVKRLKNIIFS